MPGQLKTIDRRLLARRCVACGYDGPQLRGGTVLRCPRCRCNFQDRPARSYAEMEGLLGLSSLTDTGAAPSPIETRLERSLQRWLAFLFVSMVSLIAIVYLAALAFHL